jgi:hypothetical protein
MRGRERGIRGMRGSIKWRNFKVEESQINQKHFSRKFKYR